MKQKLLYSLILSTLAFNAYADPIAVDYTCAADSTCDNLNEPLYNNVTFNGDGILTSGNSHMAFSGTFRVNENGSFTLGNNTTLNNIAGSNMLIADEFTFGSNASINSINNNSAFVLDGYASKATFGSNSSINGGYIQATNGTFVFNGDTDLNLTPPGGLEAVNIIANTHFEVNNNSVVNVNGNIKVFDTANVHFNVYNGTFNADEIVATLNAYNANIILGTSTTVGIFNSNINDPNLNSQVTFYNPNSKLKGTYKNNVSITLRGGPLPDALAVQDIGPSVPQTFRERDILSDANLSEASSLNARLDSGSTYLVDKVSGPQYTSMRINSDANLLLRRNTTVTNYVRSYEDSLIDLGANTLTIGNYATLSQATTLALDVLSGSSYGKIVTPEIGISDKATLNVRVGENALSSGSIRLTLIDADTFHVGMPAELRIAEVGVMGFDPETYVENFTNIVVGDRYKLTFVEAGVYDLALNKTERENVREKGGNQTEQGVAGALIDVGGFGSDTPMRGVADRINNLSQDPSRQREYFDALGALAPSGSDVTGTNAVSNTAQLFNAISGRFDGSFGRNFALNGVNNRGMSAGEKVVGKSAIWGQMLYNQANLKDRGSVRGFDSDSSGIALGFETNLNDNLKVGTGLSYTSTEVDVINKNNDINTYGWFGYGKYQFAKLFNETYASYGFSRYDETRNVAGSNVYAKYNSESLAVKSLIGTDFDFYGFYVTPKAGLQYMAILSDGFIDSVGQKVGDSSSDIITAVSEVKIEKGFKINETVDVLPNVKLGLSYDIKNDSNNSVVSLANGSSYTSYGMALKRTEFMSGLGAKFEIGDDVEVSVDYIGKFREDFTDNTGMITAKYKF